MITFYLNLWLFIISHCDYISWLVPTISLWLHQPDVAIAFFYILPNNVIESSRCLILFNLILYVIAILTSPCDHIIPHVMITFDLSLWLHTLIWILSVQYVYPSSPCDCIPGPVWTCPSLKPGRPLELGTAPPTRTRWISEHRQGGCLSIGMVDIYIGRIDIWK